jgi:putative exporter of polyketide antibiotics
MEASSTKVYTRELIGVIVAAMIAFTIIPYAKDTFDALNLTGIMAFGASLAITLMTFGAVLYIVEKLL